MTARANYERKMAHTFAEDVKRTDFQNKLHMDKLFMGANGADERVANKRRARIAAEQAQVPFCPPSRPPLPACTPAPRRAFNRAVRAHALGVRPTSCERRARLTPMAANCAGW